MEKIKNPEEIRNFLAKKMSGQYLGSYVNQKPNVEYEYEKILVPVTISEGGKESILFPVRRAHASESFRHPGKLLERILKNPKQAGRVLEKIEEKYVCQNKAIHNSVVYKPCVMEEIKAGDFQGPTSQFEGIINIRGMQYPIRIEKIKYKGKQILFGTVNNKLAIYTVSNFNGKKQMELHALEKLTEEQNNAKYLKKRAFRYLLNLWKNEEKKAKDILKRAKPVYSVNWPDYSDCSEAIPKAA